MRDSGGAGVWLKAKRRAFWGKQVPQKPEVELRTCQSGQAFIFLTRRMACACPACAMHPYPPTVEALDLVPGGGDTTADLSSHHLRGLRHVTDHGDLL